MKFHEALLGAADTAMACRYHRGLASQIPLDQERLLEATLQLAQYRVDDMASLFQEYWAENLARERKFLTTLLERLASINPYRAFELRDHLIENTTLPLPAENVLQELKKLATQNARQAIQLLEERPRVRETTMNQKLLARLSRQVESGKLRQRVMMLAGQMNQPATSPPGKPETTPPERTGR